MSRESIGAPPSSIVPLPVGTGSVDVDADEDGVGGRMTELAGLLVGTCLRHYAFASSRTLVIRKRIAKVVLSSHLHRTLIVNP